MRTIVVIGGKLQGVEACYLAKKAGGRTVREVTAILSHKGLQVATTQEYRNVLRELKENFDTGVGL